MPLRAVAFIVVLGFISSSLANAQSVNEPLGDPGIRPVGADGQPLNLDFETGDLTDWTATGDAWRDQPVQGPIDPKRPFGADKQSRHTGEYWIGGYEFHRDPPQGTLTSAPFKVTHNWGSFLIGGGKHAETRVELVRKDTNRVFFKISGQDVERMSPAVVNLASHVGKEIFIRIVDEHSGGWGHVNFDDFRLYPRRPKFKLPIVTPAPQLLLGDAYPFENLSGEEAAEKMIVPDGFKVQLAAQEPDITQPIAMAIDDRGRLWVAEAHSYPTREEEGQGKDRILIFEDTNLDGTFDSRKVFIEGLNLVSGLELGFGGVWVGAAPYLMFIPDRNGDDVPDGLEPQAMKADQRAADAIANRMKEWNIKHSGAVVEVKDGRATISGEFEFRADVHNIVPKLLTLPEVHQVTMETTIKDRPLDLNFAVGVEFPKDVPPGATVLLDGFGWHDTHETLNAFIWGPDGWLYGCHGVFTHSKVGKPGTPDDQRIPINAGIWRYHPTRHVFEVYAEGTSNPWGIDFNEYGDAFATACVIPHLYHIIPGARYQRQAGQHFNPHTYDDIKTIAKHRHFVGNQWNNNDRARSDDLGGGHAHAGAMIYLGGREGHAAPEWEILRKYADKPGWSIPDDTTQQGWPEEWHGKLFMNNIHGNRINVDQLIPHGSGYVGDRYPDFLLTRDKWSQWIYMTYGPDGQMYAIDWYDQNQCHRREEGMHDRTNGRIFRVSYGNSKPVKVNLKDLSDEDLAHLAIFSENEWYARHAKRILQERQLSVGDLTLRVDIELDALPRELFESEGRRIRYITVMTSLESVSFAAALGDDAPAVRSTAIKSLGSLPVTIRGESESVANALTAFGTDSSPVTRLVVASTCISLPHQLRWSVLEQLTSHPEDANDHNLPLMYWYAMEPLADVDPQRALALAMSAGENIPMLREYMVRRLGSGKPEEALKLLVEGLANAKTDDVRLTFLKGIRSAVTGRENVAIPEQWAAVYKELSEPDTTAANFDVYLHTLGLGAKFGNEDAQQTLEKIVVDEAGAYEERKVAFAFLVEDDVKNLPAIISSLLNGTTLRAEALRAAATVSDPAIAKSIIDGYKMLNAGEQADARSTLASRATYATEFLQAVDAGKIPRQDLSADLIRQLRNLDDEQVAKLLNSVWGVVRESDVDRKQLIAEYTQMIQFADPNYADPHVGRAIFAKTCQQCHTLFGEGGKVGPDITGANRKDLNYLLHNILDPSAVMAKEYQPSVLVTDSGRVITGIIKEENDQIVKIQTPNELVEVPANEIEARKTSDKSMMPDDLLKNLSQVQVQSLISYLSSSNQVALEATPDNLNRFYNGKDLTGWRATRPADQQLYSVQNGEIVGKSNGLKHNAFLVSDMLLGDFEFSCQVKLTPDAGNSGIQIRSQILPDGEMRGYQVDIGKGWWGRLYEENGRGLLTKGKYADLVRENDWNDYVIRAVGPRVTAFLNGRKVIDVVDEQGARTGQLALQIHSGDPMEIRFRNLELRLLDPIPPFARAGSPAGEFPSSTNAADEQPITWQKYALDDVFRSEGVGIADFNNDGHMDVVAGSQWYPLDPQNMTPKPYVITDPVQEFDPKGYSNTFCNFPCDVNRDGWVDLIVVDFPGKPTWWFENPGQTAELTAWTKHEITPVTNNESPQFLEITGDGKAELLCAFDQKVMGFATPKDLPTAQWKINMIAADAPGTDRFSHGIGAGDINGDGRIDILIPNGWWEAPESAASDLPWEWHPAPFGQACSQMYVYDFDGDGDNDVLSSSAHQFGIWWHENQGAGDGDPGTGELRWETHTIDESFSQTHALVLADLNGDTLPDFVTGKRYWAHGGHDPGGDQPAVVHWFELQRENGKPVWTKHQIDDDSGIGTQFDVADVNGDGLLDIATSNKKGTFLFIQGRD